MVGGHPSRDEHLELNPGTPSPLPWSRRTGQMNPPPGPAGRWSSSLPLEVLGGTIRILIAGSGVGWFVLSRVCKKWDPDANVNKSKQRGRADNTIRAGGMTTEPVRGGSGLERGGSSSRGRVRQEDRDPVA